MTPSTAWVALGSNLDGVIDGRVVDRRAMLRAAVAAIADDEELGARELRRSHVVESRALDPEQPSYLNAAIAFTTAAAPAIVLGRLLVIEGRLGRVRLRAADSRTIDLDLIAMTDRDGVVLVIDAPGLHLPHPRATQRDFVLAPLDELAPDLELHGVTVRSALAALPDAARTLLGRTVAPL